MPGGGTASIGSADPQNGSPGEWRGGLPPSLSEIFVQLSLRKVGVKVTTSPKLPAGTRLPLGAAKTSAQLSTLPEAVSKT
jgi:hypothetical protein